MILVYLAPNPYGEAPSYEAWDYIEYNLDRERLHAAGGLRKDSCDMLAEWRNVFLPMLAQKRNQKSLMLVRY